MDAEKEPSENVPMTQITPQNTLQEINENKQNGSNETASPSPTPSQKSVSAIEKEKRSQKVTIDISGDTPLVKKTVTHEESLNLLNADINSLLPGAMQIQSAEDTTNAEKNLNSAVKKEGASKDAPDGFNQYRNQKSFSQGMLDIALFTSNVNQLRAVTKNPPEPITFNFCFVILLLVCSIVFQIAVGLILLLSARYNVNKEEERKIVYKMGNYVVAGIFLITVLNLFIAVFYDYDNPVYNNNNNTNR